jgi:hypothetical protein
MSLVTLKRKTNTQYNNMSANRKGFSLNGTHRSQGFIGQTSLSRSLPRTLMRGNTVRGHGGCCGKYPTYHINTEGTGLGTNTLNDPTVIKSSVLDTNGMIMTKYRWIRRPAPITSVKPTDMLNNGSSGQYTESLKKSTLMDQCSITYTSSINNQECCPYLKTHYHRYDRRSRKDVVVKPDKTYVYYDDYLNQLTQDCVDRNIVQKDTQHTPFACSSGDTGYVK